MSSEARVDIARPHPAYKKTESVWSKVRACDSGAAAVKSEGKRFLPKPPSMSVEAYGQYLQRAEFLPAVRRATSAMVGMLFGRTPEAKLPKVVEPMLKDVDLADTSLDELAARSAREALLVGRNALVVDWSETAGRPYIARYDAEDIVDWETERVDGDERLTRIVLREKYLARENGEPVDRCRFREYQLDKGKATVTEWLPVSKAELADPKTARYVPGTPRILTRRGTPIEFLPIVIHGAQSIGPEVESPLMSDLADVALGFYQVSADYRHALYLLGCPTAIIAGSAMGNVHEPIVLGADSMLRLAAGATWGLLSLDAGSIAPLADALKSKREEAAALGARFLESAPLTNETATAALLRASGEHATLRQVGQVVERALQMALQWAAEWAGGPEAEVVYELNKEFEPLGVDPQQMNALVQAYQADAISFPTLYSLLQRRGVAREGVSVDEERDEIARGTGNATPNAVNPASPGDRAGSAGRSNAVAGQPVPLAANPASGPSGPSRAVPPAAAPNAQPTRR